MFPLSVNKQRLVPLLLIESVHWLLQDADLYGHGSHAPTYVPTFGSVLPAKMVSLNSCGLAFIDGVTILSLLSLAHRVQLMRLQFMRTTCDESVQQVQLQHPTRLIASQVLLHPSLHRAGPP